MITELFELNEKVLKTFNLLEEIDEIDVEPSEKELVYQIDKTKLYHYKPLKRNICKVPLLIVYALVNKYYMMDLQEDRSFIKKLLENGIDVYIIDWGYPDRADRYLTLEDYIDGYINSCVDFIREKHKLQKINLLGVCQGGTFSVIYTALYPEKIKNLVTMVTPIDFHTDDGLLNIWSRYMDPDLMVEAFGNISGDFMNVGYMMLKPFQLNIGKYYNFIKNAKTLDDVKNFIRMEKWIFDSPDQAGEAWRKFIKDLYQENKLVKGEFELGGRKVDLKNIKMPILTIYAEEDHLVPPSSTKPLNDLVGSEDKTMISFKGGHIGIYVSSRSQKDLAPTVAKWLLERSKNPDKLEKKKGGDKK